MLRLQQERDGLSRSLAEKSIESEQLFKRFEEIVVEAQSSKQATLLEKAALEQALNQSTQLFCELELINPS